MEYCCAELLGSTALAVGRFHPSNVFFFSLLGLFIVSLVSNASPFFGASYTVIATTALIGFGFSPQAYLLVVVITALGAALGKLVIYGGAGAFNKQLSGNKNVQLIAGWLSHRRFLVAVFFTAVIPLLPLDDYIYIAAGAAKTKLTPMVSVTILGKLVKSAFEIELEFLGIINVTGIAKQYFGLSSFEFSIVLTIAFVILGIVLFKVDWSRFLGGRSQTSVSAGAQPSVNAP